jgi:hypothetical protein
VFCDVVNRFRTVFQSARPQNFETEAMEDVMQATGKSQTSA